MILFFDTETTGLPDDWNAPITDLENWPRIIQIAYLLCDYDEKEIEKGDYLIKPNGFFIPKEATAVHGITIEKALDEGVEIEIVLEELKSVIANADYLVAHNISYDKNVLGAEFLRNGMQNFLEDKELICTMESATNFCAIRGPYGFKWPTLSELHLTLFGTTFEGAHNASKDIDITAKCFWQLAGLTIIDINEHINKKQDYSAKIHAPDLPELIPYRKGDKWGYCDRDRNIVIDIQYNFAGPFNCGRSVVKYHDNKTFTVINLIDIHNNLLLSEENGYQEIKEFFEGTAVVIRWGKITGSGFKELYGFIDINGKEFLECIYDYAEDFTNGIARVVHDEDSWFINLKGERLFYFTKEVKSFKEGFAQIITNDGLQTFINYEGEIITKQNYSETKSFHGGLACVKLNKKFGFIDKIGKNVIECLYEAANYFYEGMAAVRLNGKWGFIDSSGEIVVEFIYEYAGYFYEGMAIVKLNSKWGAIDKFGQVKIAFEYTNSNDFKFKKMCFEINNKKGYFYFYCNELFDTSHYPISSANGLLLQCNQSYDYGLLPFCYFVDKLGIEYWED